MHIYNFAIVIQHLAVFCVNYSNFSICLSQKATSSQLSIQNNILIKVFSLNNVLKIYTHKLEERETYKEANDWILTIHNNHIYSSKH